MMRLSESQLNKLHSQYDQSSQLQGLKPFYNFFGYKIDHVPQDINPKDIKGQKKHPWVADLKYFPMFLYNYLFEIWKEERDPNLYYFPQIYSYTDVNILLLHIKQKKIAGLILIVLVINIINGLVDNTIFSKANLFQNQNTDILYNSTGTDNLGTFYNSSGIDQKLQNGNQNTQTTSTSYFDSPFFYQDGIQRIYIIMINLFQLTVLIVLSFYILVTKTYDLNQSSTKLFVLLTTMMQYQQCAVVLYYPKQFFFNYYVNQTIIFFLFIKEIAQNSQQVFILCLNASFANYLVIRHLIQNPDLTFDEKYGIDNELMYRTYVFSMIVLIASAYQSQVLNKNALQMLINKINLLQQGLLMKDVYNASMIHELRNPLGAIVGSIGLLKDSKYLSPEDSETLSIASLSSEFLMTLINNTLDWAKLEANKLELDPRMNDIVQVLTKSVSLYHWKAKEKKVNIRLLIGKAIPDQVEIDDARLSQILVNIVGNAVKFTSENGSVKIRARFVADDNYSDLGFSGMDKANELRLAQGSEIFDDIEDEDFEKQVFFEKNIGIKAQMNDIDLRSSKRYVDTEVPDMQFDIGSDNDDSSVNNISGKIFPVKSDQYASLWNIKTLDENQINHIIQNINQGLKIKNPFDEDSPQINKNTNQLSSLSLTNGATHRIPTIQQIRDQLSDQSLMQSEQFKQNTSYSHSSATRRFYPGQKYSDFSSSIPPDNSVDSFVGEGDKSNSRTYTNSSGSNQMVYQKRSTTKSKFFKVGVSDDSWDDSSKEYRQITHKKRLDLEDQKINNLLSQYQFDISKEGKQQETKGTLIIEIIDSGIGMTKEGIKKLFKPFSQADKSIQAKYGGTGLGLWITDKLLGLMGGTIKVRSEINKGTVFTISIPLNAEYSSIFYSEMRTSIRCNDSPSPHKRDNQNHVQAASSDDMASQNSIHVLILQKDAIMKNLFKKYMVKQRISSKFTSDYKEFMRVFKQKAFQAIFIDLDTNIKMEDMERILRQKGASRDRQILIPELQIYCFHSHEIEKSKLKLIKKYDIPLIKKPIQDYKLSDFLRKLKDSYERQQLQVNSHNNKKRSLFEQDIFNKPNEYQKLKAPSMSTIPINLNYAHNRKHFGINNQSFNEISMVSEQIARPGATQMGFINDSKSVFTQQRKGSSNFFNADEDEATRKHSDSITKAISKLQQPSEFGQAIQAHYNPTAKNGLNSSSPDARSYENNSHNSRLSLVLEARGQDKIHFQASDKLDPLPLCKRTLDSLEDVYEGNKKTASQYLEPSLAKMKLNNSVHLRQRSHQDDEEEKNSNQTQQTANFILNSGNEAAGAHGSNNGGMIAPHTMDYINRSQSDERLRNNQMISFQSNGEDEPSSNRNAQNLVVLIVDDDKMNQLIHLKMIEKLPCITKNNVQILIANDGLEAFNIFQQQEFQKNSRVQNRVKLILMDCEMPVLNGYEATQKIREYESINYMNTCKAMIVGSTGNGGDQHARKCKQSGMNETLLKPISADQLKKLVNKAILPYTKSQFSPNV